MPEFLPKSVLDEFTKGLSASIIVTKPKPKLDEAKEDYMKRCVPMMLDEGKDQDQAVAACSVMFDEEKTAHVEQPIQLTVNVNMDLFEKLADNIKHVEELLVALSASVEKSLTAGSAQPPRKNLYDDVFRPLV
jgi:hypothetical protein